MDPCEATADKPLLYEVGWGKKLTYLIAVGRTGVLDVSRRYTRQYNDVMRSRRGLDDDWISSYLKNLTNKMRSENPEINEEERIRLEERDDADVAEMMAASEKKLFKVELESLPGRQTGGAGWINSRGEGGSGGDGSGGGGPTISSPSQQQSTRYQWARDTAKTRDKSITLKRISGGVVRASGDNPPGETVIKVFDGKLNTKWLDFGGAKENTAWLEYRLLPTDELTVLKKYALSSGDDSPERDPEHVLLEAWVEEEDNEEGNVDNGEGADGNSKNIGGRWVVLDERPGLKFLCRGHRCEFEVGKAVPTRRWRLRIVRVLHPDRANSVQLACWDLYKE
jgi:peptide-N4-(N-acetyl-beta-glucosaminyl)asparagine amidase